MNPTSVDPGTLELRTERLRLRVPGAAEAGEVAAFFRENRRFLQPWEPLRPEAFYTREHWTGRVADIARELRDDRALRLVLLDRFGERVIGTVNFTQFVRDPFHACSLGYNLAESAQGRGLMREALGAAIPFVFDRLGFHRIQANYVPHNRRSGATLRALGFVVEGYARDYLRIDGRWEDHVLTSLTNAQWREPAPRAESAGAG